jgi:hypothetical protein
MAPPGATRRWAWFVGLWVAGVAAVGTVGLVVQWVMRGV